MDYCQQRAGVLAEVLVTFCPWCATYCEDSSATSYSAERSLSTFYRADAKVVQWT